MRKETKSVIRFLENNIELVLEYFNKVKESGGDEVSYSDFISSGVVDGTTEDGVDLRSSKIQRCTVSEYLNKKFSREFMHET